MQLQELAKRYNHEVAAVRTIINVETPGFGFSKTTGRILIQFEPHWFKKKFVEWKEHQTAWAFNGISYQTEEWIAFNNAFQYAPNAAMEATSVGMMQVMGFHFKTLGFKTVGAMWDFAKESEANQVDLGMRFIKSNPALDRALREKDWYHVAYYYNGAYFQQLAQKNKSVPYDKQLKLGYLKIISS
ncbi:MAG TPA: N-acetylmuramidase domain-containing protein [Segetibacter sp.]